MLNAGTLIKLDNNQLAIYYGGTGKTQILDPGGFLEVYNGAVWTPELAQIDSSGNWYLLVSGRRGHSLNGLTVRQ